MPRIRQLADKYAEADRKKAEKEFWRDIDHQGLDLGLKSNNKIGNALDLSGACIGKYREDPNKIPVKTMRKMVEVFKPSIPVLLKFLGYTEKEIRAFATGYITQ